MRFEFLHWHEQLWSQVRQPWLTSHPLQPLHNGRSVCVCSLLVMMWARPNVLRSRVIAGLGLVCLVGSSIEPQKAVSVAGCWWSARAEGCLSGYYSSCCPFDLDYHRPLEHRVCSTLWCSMIPRQKWPNATVPKMCANWSQPFGFMSTQQYTRTLATVCMLIYVREKLSKVKKVQVTLRGKKGNGQKVLIWCFNIHPGFVIQFDGL